MYRNSHHHIIEYNPEMFYNYNEERTIRIAVLAALFLLGTASIFSQDELSQRGSIPEELLRPRKSEAPRYPIDTVIGELGQGKAPKEAYDIARNTATALLSGNINAPVLSSVSKVYLEGWMDMLNDVSPQIFRIGGGRQEPDGSVSFLVRFAGREQGITGELFIRAEERRQPAPIAAAPPPPAEETEIVSSAEDDSATLSAEENQAEEQAAGASPVPAPVVPVVADTPVEQRWLFEDLILEEARNREEENKEDRHRFDFSPYQRFF
jgi:hypothetical protein